MTALRRPLLRYYGSKWTIAPWIISNFPAHDAYVEPFAGAAAVLLRKPPEPIEVYNDADGEVVNFFRVMREQPDVLIRAIALTPYSRAELAGAYDPPADDPIERARCLYIRAWQSHGGPRAVWRTGWRFERSDSRGKPVTKDWDDTDRLQALAARLKNVQIECGDALEVIQRFDSPDALFYLDPPYLPETRSERWRAKSYTVEFGIDEHVELAELLRSIEGMALLSGYPSPVYDELFEGWTCVTKTVQIDPRNKLVRGQMSRKSRAVECLWLNPAAADAARQMRLVETG